MSEPASASSPQRGYLCPKCGKDVGPDGPWRPFCCERCKNVDLGAWLLGHYRVPAVEAPDEAPEEGFPPAVRNSPPCIPQSTPQSAPQSAPQSSPQSADDDDDAR